jgi:hypothetical protein
LPDGGLLDNLLSLQRTVTAALIRGYFLVYGCSSQFSLAHLPRLLIAGASHYEPGTQASSAGAIEWLKHKVGVAAERTATAEAVELASRLKRRFGGSCGTTRRTNVSARGMGPNSGSIDSSMFPGLAEIAIRLRFRESIGRLVDLEHAGYGDVSHPKWAISPGK